MNVQSRVFLLLMNYPLYAPRFEVDPAGGNDHDTKDMSTEAPESMQMQFAVFVPFSTLLLGFIISFYVTAFR